MRVNSPCEKLRIVAPTTSPEPPEDTLELVFNESPAMPYHSVELGLRRIHRESFEVHRGLIRLDTKDICAKKRPETSIRAILARNPHLRLPRCLHKQRVGGRVPRIHVLQDAAAQRRFWAIKKGDGQPDSLRAPVFSGQDSDVLRESNKAGNNTRQSLHWRMIHRIDLDCPLRRLNPKTGIQALGSTCDGSRRVTIGSVLVWHTSSTCFRFVW